VGRERAARARRLVPLAPIAPAPGRSSSPRRSCSPAPRGAPDDSPSATIPPWDTRRRLSRPRSEWSPP
jgi:hypothetical protein